MNCARHEGDKSVGGFFKMDAKTNMTSNKKDVWKSNIIHQFWECFLCSWKEKWMYIRAHVDDFNN